MKTVIFRPTNECNLACKYCYDLSNHDDDIRNIRRNATKHFIKNQEMLVDGIHFLHENERRKIIIFHGGEPLLIDPETLDNFCSRFKNVNFHIQTNGTLINQDVIDLFKKYDFRVGISLDGCNELQNSYRVFKNQSSTFPMVMDKMKLLREQKVHFGAIMSISKKHIGSAEELYQFLGKNHLNINLRRVFANDHFSDTMSDEEYVNFFNQLFDIWYDDQECLVETRQVTDLASELETILKGEHPQYCSASDDCFNRYISLDVDGELYACNRLYGIKDFYYGNVTSITKEELRRKQRVLLEKRNGNIQKECCNCDRLQQCNGGCPAEAYDIYHDFTKPNCDYKVKQLVRTHIKERVSND